MRQGKTATLMIQGKFATFCMENFVPHANTKRIADLITPDFELEIYHTLFMSLFVITLRIDEHLLFGNKKTNKKDESCKSLYNEYM